MFRPVRGVFVAVISAAVISAAAPGSRAESDPVVAKGIQYLKARVNSLGTGETALAALAMIKFDVPFGDPALAACINKLRARTTGGIYTPERSGGQDVYEAALVAMVLANLDLESRRESLNGVTQYLIGKQKPKGCWDYDNRTNGDCSISQYGVLGLWEAESLPARVPPEVWDRAARFYISVQRPDGSWVYHPDENLNSPGTISMTAAGVGSLLICRRQLGLASRSITPDLSPLLVPLAAEGADGTYEPRVSTASIDRAVKRGLAWLGANFATEGASVGHSVYYGLYGIERIGALADRETLGRVNWFELGQRFIQSKQLGDGSWSTEFGPEPNTAWAILFLTKSTAKTLRRIEIKRLGAGTLLGGRDLPKDLTSMTVAGGRVISRPMNGAIEGMLAVLEDPARQNADSALAGLVARYETEGPVALRPHKSRFRALLADRDPGLRRIAAWALGRTADMDVVPTLIGALTDPDDDVVTAARLSLQLLSRKVEGFGPPSPSSPEQRREAARKWRSWYDAIRPLDVEAGDLEDASPIGEAPMSQTVTPETPAVPSAPVPTVRGESYYDQVTSFLMAVVIGAVLVVGWLGLVYMTNQAYASRVTAPLEIVDVFGGGGGSPEGNPGSTEKIDVAGAEAATQASNNEEEAASFEEPSVQQTPAAMLDAVADAGHGAAEVNLGAVMPSGGAVASGRRASKLGGGGPGLGFGPGDGGVPREQRWSILYNPGQTLDEYARQLDALGVELAVISGPEQLTYVSNFSSPTPTKRFGNGQGDHRLFFLWQGQGRKGSDVALLNKAGIDVGEGVVIQFYPDKVEEALAQLEVRYRGRQPAEIRVTRFSVVPKGDGYGFTVLAQETLR